MRFVVTGSRNWSDERAIIDALVFAMSVGARDERHVVVQGGALGADAIAKKWATTRQILCETFDADWSREGKAAGPKRNRRMLDAGADLVLAFPIGGRPTSPGTWDCVEAAAERGITVRIYPQATFEGTVAR